MNACGTLSHFHESFKGLVADSELCGSHFESQS